MAFSVFSLFSLLVFFNRRSKEVINLHETLVFSQEPFSFFLFFFFIIFTIIFIFFELKNGRYWQSDFEVYYKSAKRALLGENLYRPDEDGFYRFKYSPFSAYLFIPFTLLPFTYAKYLYSFFISLLMFFNFLYCFLLGSEILIKKLKKKYETNRNIEGMEKKNFYLKYKKRGHLGEKLTEGNNLP